mgnify:CR=1 FL=1
MTGLLLLVSTVFASSSANRLVARHQTPIVVAHRGASAAAPENTIAAIEEASKLGVPLVEFDVRSSSDGELFVIHDRTLARTTDGTGRVSRTSADTLRLLDAGSWFSDQFAGERIPSLAQALDALGPETVAAIEIKTRASVMPLVLAAMRTAGKVDEAVVFSFHPRQIQAARRVAPMVPTLLLIDPVRTGVPYSFAAIQTAVAIGASAVGLNHESVTHAVVDHAHSLGLPVFVYTVDAQADVERMVALGVDGVISNRPRATKTHIAVARHRLTAGQPE